jgi:ribokinase
MSAASGSVLVFGSINTDLVVYLPRLPYPGETVSGGTYASFPGGKGANAAVAAARSGAGVRMYGAVGADPFGEERRKSLAAEGIDTSGIVVKPGVPSGVAQIWVDARGENSIAVAPGANAAFAAGDVGGGPPPCAPGAVASFQNEVPQAATEALLQACKAAGYVTVWNVAPECSVRPGERSLAAADYLIFNENEIQAFRALLDGGSAALAGPEPAGLDADGAADAARGLISRGARNVIVTLGRAGSVWVGAGEPLRQPAFPVEAVDTVGAGDCFCGVFAASLAAGLGTAAAMRRAAAGAAVSVTRKGAQSSMPTAAEIDAFLGERGAPKATR